MFHRILAAVDASERAAGVFQLAVDVARGSNARLYVMRVITIPPEFPPAAAGSPTDPLIARTAGTAMHDLERLIAGAPDDISIQQPIVRLGVPWKVILETAEARDVDLIVVGSHGYQGWDRVLGTTAAKIANIAERNVLISHDRKQRSEPHKKEPEEPEMTGRDSSRSADGIAGAWRATRAYRFRPVN